MSMTSKEEAAVLRSLDAFILKTARRYFVAIDAVEDAAQEGRIAAILSMRSWREESGAKLSTHCMRNIWWRIHAISRQRQRRKEVELSCGNNSRSKGSEEAPADNCPTDSIDHAAINAEQALIVLEIFNALTPSQQHAIEHRIGEVVRGQPSREYQNATIAATAWMRS